MALKSNGSTFLDDNRNYSATANTALANDAYILIANNDSVSSDGYSISDTKAIADDGFAFNQFNAEEQSISFSPVPPPQAQGSISGYASGGGPAAATYIEIDKFSFTSDGNAVDIGDLTVGRRSGAGASSTVSGYTAGGINISNYNTIDKFPFAADGNATDVGDLLTTKWGHGGNTSTESGYATAGYPASNIIQKFPFASDGNATDVGDLLTTKYSSSSQSSKTDGYNSGGAPNKNTIEKFPFATDANSTDVGDLIGAFSNLMGGQSGDVSGYSAGGFDPAAPGDSDRIEKFPFATDTNSTDVGNLTQARRRTGGSSSTESGYVLGGANPGAVNTIDKFPFASDANATDVGDLSQVRNEPVGQQV